MSSRRPTSDRPSIARADRRERERFRAMAVRAGECPSTADAFAFAYRNLSARDRVRMARAVARDLSKAGDDAGPALAIFLAVEEDASVCAEVLSLLVTLEEPKATARASASLYGASPPDAVLVGMPTGGEWTGLLVEGDDSPEVRVLYAESFGELERHVARLTGRAARRVGLDEAVELAAPRLLQHRRANGSLPPAARPFAEIFSR